jgi:chromate transporter
VKKIRESVLFSAFLDAVNVASVALIAAICIEMGKGVFTDWKTNLIGVISVFIVFRFPKINSAWLVLGGALAGYVL